jgi:hypothetical protein
VPGALNGGKQALLVSIHLAEIAGHQALHLFQAGYGPVAPAAMVNQANPVELTDCGLRRLEAHE